MFVNVSDYLSIEGTFECKRPDKSGDIIQVKVHKEKFRVRLRYTQGLQLVGEF